MREKKRAKGYDEVKLIFVDVKKARLNAKCEEEEWVELPDEFKNCGRYAKLEMAIRKGSVGMGGRLCNKTARWTCMWIRIGQRGPRGNRQVEE